MHMLKIIKITNLICYNHVQYIYRLEMIIDSDFPYEILKTIYVFCINRFLFVTILSGYSLKFLFRRGFAMLQQNCYLDLRTLSFGGF